MLKEIEQAVSKLVEEDDYMDFDLSDPAALKAKVEKLLGAPELATWLSPRTKELILDRVLTASSYDEVLDIVVGAFIPENFDIELLSNELGSALGLYDDPRN